MDLGVGGLDVGAVVGVEDVESGLDAAPGSRPGLLVRVLAPHVEIEGRVVGLGVGAGDEDREAVRLEEAGQVQEIRVLGEGVMDVFCFVFQR